MISVTIPEAKSRLAELIDQVSAGEHRAPGTVAERSCVDCTRDQ